MSAAEVEALATPEELIAEIRAGRMVVLVDAEDRENEGDLVIAAEYADADAINFMATYGRGLICLALTEERVRALGLPMMERRNAVGKRETAFTLSIEALEGVSTGISAADRARTIAVASDPECGPEDIVSPGHVFPIRARDGGVLVRAGHTEASVDLARLAGSRSAAVICEILRDDGAMARLEDLKGFVGRHGLRLGTIRDLIAYRRRAEPLVRRLSAPVAAESTYGGGFMKVMYEDLPTGREHVALVLGDVGGEGGDSAPLVRVQSASFVEALSAAAGVGPASAASLAMRRVVEAGRGVVVLLARRDDGADAPEAGDPLIEVGIGAQILRDLGVRRFVGLSDHPRKIIGLEGYGLALAGWSPLRDASGGSLSEER